MISVVKNLFVLKLEWANDLFWKYTFLGKQNQNERKRGYDASGHDPGPMTRGMGEGRYQRGNIWRLKSQYTFSTLSGKKESWHISRLSKEGSQLTHLNQMLFTVS